MTRIQWKSLSRFVRELRRDKVPMQDAVPQLKLNRVTLLAYQAAFGRPVQTPTERIHRILAASRLDGANPIERWWASCPRRLNPDRLP